ncbi:MAG: type II toxin-antitoxin system RelE/ParE family toxin [Candidatus Omnitrophica bacterium]|nr:type II toxin-antitoxin system RelE/ParE family toxin [Candidatus Omnitrophota bacterium]
MLPLIRVEEYIALSGVSPFAEWFNDLSAPAAAKINTYLTRIREGKTASLKPIKGAFQEVVIDWGPGYRVYVGKDGDKLIILFGGGTKKQQQKDLDRAQVLWQEYKERKKGGEYACHS